MKKEVTGLVIFGLLCVIFGAWTATKPAHAPTGPPPSGIESWLSDTNSPFGVWAAKSTRIVRTADGKFQPQFRDCNDTNASWVCVFVGDKAYDSLAIAQFHTRRTFEVQKAVCDAFQSIKLPAPAPVPAKVTTQVVCTNLPGDYRIEYNAETKKYRAQSQWSFTDYDVFDTYEGAWCNAWRDWAECNERERARAQWQTVTHRKHN